MRGRVFPPVRPEDASFGVTCPVCSVTPGKTLPAQHNSCDWHRYNLLLKMQDKPPVSEERFGRLLAQSGMEGLFLAGKSVRLPTDGWVYEPQLPSADVNDTDLSR